MNRKTGMMQTTVLVLLGLALSPLSTAQDWELQRMPWGDPDLQGIWTSATLTTLTRPDEIEGLVLTEQQATGLEKFGEDYLKENDDVGEGDLQAGENVGGD